MDIEDAHKLKILTTQETKELYFQFFTEARKKRIHEICQLVTDTNEQIAYLRTSAIGVLIQACTQVFVDNEEQILSGAAHQAHGRTDTESIRKLFKDGLR